MAKDTHTQFGFNSGELSPFLAARTDIDRYAYGARTMTNFIPMLQGPARKRPGTKFIHNLRERCWLVSTVFSQTDSWVLAFGDGVVSFFTDRGAVLETADTVTAMTNANPGVFTAAAHGFAANDEVYVASLPGTTGLAGRVLTVNTVPTGNTFTLKDMWGAVIDTTSVGALSSNGSVQRLYKIVSPYSAADLLDANDCFTMSFAQSEDVLYTCVPGYQPRKLTRSASASWAFSVFEPKAGPFIGVDPDETITVYASASSGTGVTLTASSAIFEAGHVGSLFLLERNLTEITTSWEAGKAAIAVNTIRRSQGHYYKALNNGKTTGTITPSHTEGSRFDGDDGVNWQYLHSGYGWAEITAIGGGGTTATVDVLSYIPEGAVGSGNASTQWSHGAWSDVEGWPTHVCFFRERLWFGRGTKLWASVPSDFENFAERDAGVVADDSAISIDIRTGKNDQIKWLVPSSDLLVGSDGNEFSVGEISTSEPLGPGNIASLRGPGYGTRQVQPALVNDGVLYVLPGGRVVRELRYSTDGDGYTALNRTAFAEHMTYGLVTQMAFAKEPESIVWFSCQDGRDLLGMSFEREHQLLAWHRHHLGGASGIYRYPIIESQTVTPAPAGNRDELYLCVRRIINGQTVHYLEYVADHWDENSQGLEDMYYVDCGLTNEANTSTTLSGLEHLEGQILNVLGDGRVMGPYTVTNGAITLSSAPTVVHAGLSYQALLESMNISRPDFLARIVNVFVNFISTVFASAGGYTNKDNSTRESWGPRSIPWNFLGQPVSDPTRAQSRVVKVKNEGNHGREVFFQIIHDQPTACTVAGWIMDTRKDAA